MRVDGEGERRKGGGRDGNGEVERKEGRTRAGGGVGNVGSRIDFTHTDQRNKLFKKIESNFFLNAALT